MYPSSIVILFSLYFIGSFCFSNATVTEEQKTKIHELFESSGLKCIQNNPISEGDITDLRARNEAKGENVPCFLACMMKEIGAMDKDGKFQKESILDIAKSILDDDATDKLQEYMKSCEHINDGDSDGCTRALEAYKCMKQFTGEFFGQ